MRVAIDYTAAINQSDGIGRFVQNLVHSLTAIDHENQYLLLHATPNAGRQLAPPVGPNVRTRELRFRERTLNILWQRLHLPIFADLATGPVDVFHSPNFVLPPVRNATSIVTVHDLAFLMHPECADERLAAYLERAVPLAASRADLIVTDSESTRNDVICLLDADADRVFVVPGGVGPSFAPTNDNEIDSVRHKLELDGPYILAVGTIEPRKNLPRLIDAFARFRSRTEAPHKLVIAGGRGWLSDETFRRAAQSSFSSDIRFLGHVADEDLPALYAGADVFVYPSLYEGFGLPVLEAMACGVPVVCSDTSSLPEFADGAAQLIPPEDTEAIANAVEAVCTDDDLRESLRTRGTARAAEYTWERSARCLLDVYARAAAMGRNERTGSRRNGLPHS